MSYFKTGLGDLQFYQRSPFMYGAGLNAPGGAGGPTFGPRQYGGGPGSCSELSGGKLVCVGAPYREGGLQTGRSWPPEIGPQEEAMMDQGCVATSRRCGGSARAPSQYWCCPGDALFVGSITPPTMAGLGTNGQVDPTRIAFGHMLPVGLLILGAFVAFKIYDYSTGKK